MRKNIFTFLLILSISVVFLGCSKNNKSVVGTMANAGGMAKKADFAVADSYAMEAAEESKVMADTAEENFSSDESVERKLIRTGRISLQVESLSEAENQCESWCRKYGGYVSESSVSERNLFMTLRIPEAKFDSALKDIESIGSVKSKSLSAQDVTDSFYDLSSRLETRKILLARLQNYLENAKNMEDLLSIENQLNNVQSEVESMEGRLKRLSDQISFCTLSVDMYLPFNQAEEGYSDSSFAEAAAELFHNFSGFLKDLILVIIGIIIFGIPILLVIALFYFVCFGKVGLLRKLFSRIKK